MRLFKNRIVSCIFALAIVGVCGCGGEVYQGPETFPVKGRLEFTDGGSAKALADRQSSIQFSSIDQPGVKAVGEIKEDGTFTVATFHEGKTRLGAVNGSHKVRLAVDEGGARPVAEGFEKFDTSGIVVKVPSDQEIVVKVWR